MSIIIESDALERALAYAPSSKSGTDDPKAVTGNSLFRTKGDRLEVIQSDRQFTVVQRLDVMGSLTPVCISSQTLAKIAKLSDGPMTLTLMPNGRVAVEAGQAVHRLPTYMTAHFPPVPQVKGEPCYVRGDLFRRMVEQSTYAIDKGQDDGRGLNNLLIRVQGGTLTMVATDTKRMVVLTYDGVGLGADFEVLLPRASAELFGKFAAKREQIAFVADDNHARIAPAVAVPNQPGEVWALDETASTIYSRISAEQYPNWEMLVNNQDHPHSAEIDIETLKAVIKRANVAAETRTGTRAVQLWTFMEGQLRVEARTPDLAECEELLDIEGGPAEQVSIGVAGTQVLDFLGHLLSEKVVVRFKDEGTILHFRPNARGSFDALYVKVPVRWHYEPPPPPPKAAPRTKAKKGDGAE